MRYIVIMLLLIGSVSGRTNVHLGIGYENNIKYVKHGLHTYLGYEFFIFEYTKSAKWDTFFSKSDGYGGLLHLNGFVIGGGVHMDKPYIKTGYKAEHIYVTASVKHITKHERALALSIGMNFGSYSNKKYNQDIEHKNLKIKKIEHNSNYYKERYSRSLHENTELYKKYTNLNKDYINKNSTINSLRQELHDSNNALYTKQMDYINSLDSLDSVYFNTFDDILSEYKDSLTSTIIKQQQKELKYLADSLKYEYSLNYKDMVNSYNDNRIKKINGNFNINGIYFGMLCSEVVQELYLNVDCSNIPEQDIKYTNDGIDYVITISQKYGVVRIVVDDVYDNMDTYTTDERKYTELRKLLQRKYGGWWSKLSKIDDTKHRNLCDQTLYNSKVTVSLRFSTHESCYSKIPYDDTKYMGIVYFSPEFNKHGEWMKKLLSEKL